MHQIDSHNNNYDDNILLLFFFGCQYNNEIWELKNTIIIIHVAA